MGRLDRRRFAQTLAAYGAVVAAGSVLGKDLLSALTPSAWAESTAGPELVRFPQKTEMILLTDRPPQLETPLRYFLTDLTPNDAFFVRWHLSGIPTEVDTRTFRLGVSGKVQKPLSLSLQDLRTKFEPVTTVALCQCAGHFRSLFEPRALADAKRVSYSIGRAGLVLDVLGKGAVVDHSA